MVRFYFFFVFVGAGASPGRRAVALLKGLETHPPNYYGRYRGDL